MNKGLGTAPVTVLEGDIVIAGASGFGDSVELYDPVTDEWRELSRSKKSRKVSTLIESCGFLYAIDSDKVIERFNPFKNSWKEVRELNI